MLAQRGTMAVRGHRLIQQLILMYAEFVRAEVTARILQPSGIFVDGRCEHMTFTDLSALAFHGEPVRYFQEPLMPYNNQALGVNWNTPDWSKDWDLWSVGMMTLEVIVGTELVLTLKDYESVEKLMTDVRGHIPAATHQLLHQMLFQVQDKQAVRDAKRADFESIYQVEKAVNGIENAKRGNSLIRARVDEFNAYADSHADVLAADYGWTKQLEQ